MSAQCVPTFGPLSIMGVSFPLGRKQPGCIEMAIYAKYILPRLIDFAMKTRKRLACVRLGFLTREGKS